MGVTKLENGLYAESVEVLFPAEQEEGAEGDTGPLGERVIVPVANLEVIG